jgi:hypothetical protein
LASTVVLQAGFADWCLAILNRRAADAGCFGAARSRAPQRDRTVKQDASSRMVHPSLDALSKGVFVVGFHDAKP